MKKILFQTKPIYKLPKLCSSECRLSYFSIHACELPEGLMKAQTSGLTNRASNSMSLGWDLRIHISTKFSGYADTAVLETAL